MMFLLDVNALLAMRYGVHVHNERVRNWVLQNVDTARDELEDLKASMNMLFIPDDLPTRHLPMWVRKSEQTTDGYLFALAKSHRGSLATLERFIPGAVFIPEETTGPLMIREPCCFELLSRSREIELR